MNLPRYARVLLAIGSGAALGFAFPNYNLTLLAWVSLGMLVLASVDAPVGQAPLYGFLHGQVFYPVVLAVGGYRDAAVWEHFAVGFGGVCCGDRHAGRFGLHDLFYRRCDRVAAQQAARVHRGAVSVDGGGILPDQSLDLRIVVGFVGLPD